MADGDPDFITPVCGFVDACFAKKKAIYELQMKLWYSQKMFTYLRPTTVNSSLLRGPHSESPNGDSLWGRGKWLQVTVPNLYPWMFVHVNT